MQVQTPNIHASTRHMMSAPQVGAPPASQSMLPHHYETSGFVAAIAEQVFAHLDDHTRLSSHMSKSSWKMGGGRMALQFDEQQGRRVGSRIRLAGRVFGLALSVEEIVMERQSPYRKVWETIGAPRLLVIAHYRLGFEITPEGSGSVLRVFIDYALPERGLARWCGVLFGSYYAKWCTNQMLEDAASQFSTSTPT